MTESIKLTDGTKQKKAKPGGLTFYVRAAELLLGPGPL